MTNIQNIFLKILPKEKVERKGVRENKHNRKMGKIFKQKLKKHMLQMSYKHIQRCSTSITSGKCKFKPQYGTTIYLSELLE